MPTLSVVKNYLDANTLTQTQLDQAFASLETFINTTKLDSDNLQSGAVETANIASAAVDSTKLANASVGTSALIDANVTTGKLADSSVTTAKLTDANVTTAKLADANVTTAKIANAAITAAKLSSFVSNSSSRVDSFITTSTFSSTGSPGALVTGLAATIPASGVRAVLVKAVGEYTVVSLSPKIGAFFAPSGGSVVTFYRNGSYISSVYVAVGSTPASAISFVDTSAPAGSVTYQVYIGAFSGGTSEVQATHLTAIEL